MRALTVRQPHASLIIAGIKPVENRTWPVPKTLWTRNPRPSWPNGDLVDYDSPFPFRIAIHAGARHDGNEFRRALLRATVLTGEGEPDNTMQWIRGWWANRDAIGGYGALIGTVLVTGCHGSDTCQVTDGLCSAWGDTKYGVYHWTLTDPVEVAEPIPMRGRQGLWAVPDDVLAEVAA